MGYRSHSFLQVDACFYPGKEEDALPSDLAVLLHVTVIRENADEVSRV